MIIFLVGPPGVGKSTFAAMYTLNNPDITYCSIDQCREFYEDEKIAWKYLEEIVFSSKQDVLIETSGLNWRLSLIKDKCKENSIPILTICLYGSEKLLHERLLGRQKQQNKKKFHYDEQEFLQYVFDHLSNLLIEADIKINISDMSKTQVYQELSIKLANIRKKYV